MREKIEKQFPFYDWESRNSKLSCKYLEIIIPIISSFSDVSTVSPSRYLSSDMYCTTFLPEDKRYETHSHYENIQEIESISAETSRMENEPVRYYFKQAFYGEDCCEEIVEIIQNLKTQRDNFSPGLLNLPTLFLSELELRGSSAASMTLETRMQRRTRLPK